MWNTKREVSNEVIRLHGTDYRFVILEMVDEDAELHGYLLEMTAADQHGRVINCGDKYAHPDLRVLRQVMQAAIEEEEEERYFMLTNGSRLFSRMDRKVLDQKQNKNKVFSLRLDAEMQKSFSKKCRERGHSKSVVVRILMEKYIEANSFSLS